MRDKKIVDSFNKTKPDEKMKERMLSKIINSDNSTVESNLKNSIRKEFFMRKKSVVAAVVALCIMAVSGTAYAGYKWMSAEQAVEKLGDKKLASYFGKTEEEIKVEESDKYRVVYLGVVSGVNLREEIGPEKIDQKKTYVAVAVERKDGKPIEDELEFVVSPFIKGIKPMDFNVYAMGASCTVKIVDGVDYYLLECDDIEIFADRGIYLAVMDSPNMGQGYRFDKKTGEITRNKEFEGLNLLFEVELDKSKADSKAAQEYVDEVIYGGNNSDEDIGRTYLEFEGYNDLKNPQEVIRQAKQIKGSEKNLTPNKNGMIKYVTDEINLETSAKAVKEKGIDTVLLYGEGEEDEILTFTYENGKYIGRLYICSQYITRKAENK